MILLLILLLFEYYNKDILFQHFVQIPCTDTGKPARLIVHAFMGQLLFYHPPSIKLSRSDAEFKRPVLFGEHTEYICSQILGMSRDEIDSLAAEGIFE
jgi:hypothetical protein